MIATLLTIVFLIAMWVAVLAAPVLQNRGGVTGRVGEAIRSRRSSASWPRLERAAPYRAPFGRAVGRPACGAGPADGSAPCSAPPNARRMPSSGQRAAQRRRLVLVGLVVASVVTTLAAGAYVLGGWFVLLHLWPTPCSWPTSCCWPGRCEWHAEREMKVAFLPHRRPGAEPTALLQRRRPLRGSSLISRATGLGAGPRLAPRPAVGYRGTAPRGCSSVG